MKKWKREGYSLVELMIAITLTAFVVAGILALFGFGARNMRITQAMVALQNQAKDATNHISTYVMEASDIEWDEDKSALIVKRMSISQTVNPEGKYPDPVVETCYYWMGSDSDGGSAIYFAKKDKVVDPTDSTKVYLTPGPQFLLVDDIKDFQCEVKENEDTGKKVLHVEIKLENEQAAFECKKDIYMRNQVKEEEAE